jgi:hypothetical protein
MARLVALAGLAALALAGCLTGCKGGESDPQAAATAIPKQVAAQKGAAPAIESAFGTPVKDRVATIGLLNKRNNLSQDLVMKPGESRRVGNVVIKLDSCERTLPWEQPQETGAFVQVFVEERANADAALAWRQVFSGWLFKESPSLNVIEHPVYDVWVKACAMKFPGEEDSPAPAASASNAPKPSGSASAAPAPQPSSKPSVAASPAAPD